MVRFPGKHQGRAAADWGIAFAGSTLVFPGRDGAPFSNQAFAAPRAVLLHALRDRGEIEQIARGLLGWPGFRHRANPTF